MSAISGTALAIAMIAAFVLLAGGVKLALSHSTHKQGLLVIVAALVLVGNVLIWTL